MNTERYLDVVVAQLRYLNVPEHLVDSIRRETEAHLAESGEDPVEAFGPPAEYAAAVARAAGFALPDGPARNRGVGGSNSARGLISPGLGQKVERNPMLYVFMALTVVFTAMAVFAGANALLASSYTFGDGLLVYAVWYSTFLFALLAFVAYLGMRMCAARHARAASLRPGTGSHSAPTRRERRILVVMAVVMLAVTVLAGAWLGSTSLTSGSGLLAGTPPSIALVLLALLALVLALWLWRTVPDAKPEDARKDGTPAPSQRPETLWGSGTRG